ncbi:MAG: ABC transporter ATP-binding protein, partial [Rhodobacteraceae bacterium]|nr:ABC transporter ATP-binding protein [Paracoccaceae bacterium]
MDEPLSNLDAKLRVQTRTELAEMQQRLGVTTVYVTHDQVEAMTMGHRVAVLKDGVLQQCDTPHTLYHSPANRFVAGFIGSPAMNLVEGAIRHGVFEAPDTRIAGLPTRYSGPITLGFRAEDAGIVDAGGQIAAPVYSVELLGEATMISYRLGDGLVSVKGSKDYRTRIGERVHAAVPAEICHLFDKSTGRLVWAGNAPHRPVPGTGATP